MYSSAPSKASLRQVIRRLQASSYHSLPPACSLTLQALAWAATTSSFALEAASRSCLSLRSLCSLLTFHMSSMFSITGTSGCACTCQTSQ